SRSDPAPGDLEATTAPPRGPAGSRSAESDGPRGRARVVLRRPDHVPPDSAQPARSAPVRPGGPRSIAARLPWRERNDVALVAITRCPGPELERCELTHLERLPIDIDRARSQHRAYQDALRGVGIEVLELPSDPALPDGVFVEDTAVVLDE